MAENKVITVAELQQHTKKENLWVLLHGKVYSVAKFIDEHPGGDEVILAEAGKDATEAFEDVGHSDEARALLPDMLVGEFEGGSNFPATGSTPGHTAGVAHSPPQSSSSVYFLPLALLVAYFAWRFYSASA